VLKELIPRSLTLNNIFKSFEIIGFYSSGIFAIKQIVLDIKDVKKTGLHWDLLLESDIKHFICQGTVAPSTGNNSSETSQSSDATSYSTDTTSSSLETNTSQKSNYSEKSSLIWILIIGIIIVLIIIAGIGIFMFRIK
jgi:hypothetical protein